MRLCVIASASIRHFCIMRFCRICGRERPNEKVSGSGHRDHVCKECGRLPRKEREEIEQQLKRLRDQQREMVEDMDVNAGAMLTDAASLEERGREVVHDLERFLNTLGTIASISPLLGLLGTVIGMISVFAAITQHGVGDPGALAGGISQALVTTVLGVPSSRSYWPSAAISLPIISSGQ